LAEEMDALSWPATELGAERRNTRRERMVLDAGRIPDVWRMADVSYRGKERLGSVNMVPVALGGSKARKGRFVEIRGGGFLGEIRSREPDRVRPRREVPRGLP
jgi:hypothetical protein